VLHGRARGAGLAQLRALREELAKIQVEVQGMARQVGRLTQQLDDELEVIEAHLVA
jgi:hypothetical protein